MVIVKPLAIFFNTNNQTCFVAIVYLTKRTIKSKNKTNQSQNRPTAKNKITNLEGRERGGVFFFSKAKTSHKKS